MVCAGQSSDRAALIYQHSTSEQQKEVAAALDARIIRAERAAATPRGEKRASGTDLARES